MIGKANKENKTLWYVALTISPLTICSIIRENSIIPQRICCWKNICVKMFHLWDYYLFDHYGSEM